MDFIKKIVYSFYGKIPQFYLWFIMFMVYNVYGLWFLLLMVFIVNG